ncbi:MarR family winged helix-turn-helix transcriptional regulator [Achromobacter sp. AONIH1]|uniref:MarR family winged helix-turn-helix transcriptional regulator n=1 Tax=Achromobacter sp. AONIH1 TaxID=1758194 RepID=UPI000CD17406|nr:MarR family transcriptional regulator [Achromobacter sp. AONIH1]AUT47624.1 MarR family transcriptional regulator [Achromobacter sp. AONIH1]
MTHHNKPARTADAASPYSHLHPDDDLIGRGIAQWRRERPDIDSSGKEVVGRLIRLEEVVLRAINASQAPHGLKYIEYAVLTTLRVDGAPYQLAPSQLQARLLCSSGGLSNILKRLETQGLVRRTTDKADRRGVLVTLTVKGKHLADKAMPAHAQAEQNLLAMFTPEERDTLARLLSRMLVVNAPELGREEEA